MHSPAILRSNAFRFLLIGALFVYLGLQNRPGGWLLAWWGISFACVSVAYALSKPSFFGKRPDGSQAWWAWIPFGPHLFFAWIAWQAGRLLSREDICNEIAPGIWLGRRPYASELPANISLIVDLTSEFRLAPSVAKGKAYLCLPVFDGSVTDLESFTGLVEKAAAWKDRGIYIHCALGHGRSAMVAAAVLIRRGLQASAVEAVNAIQQVRPGVGLHASQMGLLEDFAASIK
ncbi:MAG: dual specificity protein phosphatase family protein [Elusimicrobia bacterium]|nr:dual specificity protein phosphatase family protein [Elusimicrobiota bacterium]